MQINRTDVNGTYIVSDEQVAAKIAGYRAALADRYYSLVRTQTIVLRVQQYVDAATERTAR